MSLPNLKSEDIPLGTLDRNRDEKGNAMGSGSNGDSHDPVPKGHQNRDADASSLDSSSMATEKPQAGVQNIEAVSMAWTKWGLITAYLSIFLMAFTTSLEGQVVQSLSVFATSSFKSHSLISTVYVVQGVVNAVIKPPMAKVADVFGRLESFSFAVLLYILGYIQMATSSNVQTYAAAQIFYSAGSAGLQILQQIFIADTSNLLNRALWSSLPDIPFLITVWIGSIIGNAILGTTTWRWGYGMWTIILPAMFLPLALTLFLNNRKARKLGLTATSLWSGLRPLQVLKNIWHELDLGGIILLSTAFALILIPLTIATRATNGWRTPSIIVMIVLGFLCLIAFPLWEASKRLAPRPLIPLYLLKSRTFCAGCALGFFYFMAYYLSVQPYFYSYLLVVQNESVTAAGHITQTFSFTSTVASIAISFVIKYTHVYKPFICIGALIYIMGIGLMIRYRNQGVALGSIVGSQIAVGIGGGMLNVPAQLGVQASTDHQHVAVATAVFLTTLEIGGAVGSAISGAVWSRNIPSKLEEYLPLPARENATAIYNDINIAKAYAMGTPERAAINRAYQETMRILLIIAICVAVPIIPLSFLMRNYRLDKKEQGVKGRVIGGNIESSGEDTEDVDGREFGIVRGDSRASHDATPRKRLGSWLQWPMMKKRASGDVTNPVQ